MKKLVAMAALLALALALTGCVTQVTKESKPSLSANEATASASSASSSAKASSSASSSATIKWTSAKTADEAAKGAGIDLFAVPDSIVIADITFSAPTFYYTEHVAQATYEVSGTAKLVVRKAEGAHTAPLTDSDKSSFAQSWKNNYEGFEVTCYGDKQGEASICLWNDGTKEYGVEIAGHGSNKVTMDAEDVDDIVKAIKAAEGGQTAEQTQSSSASAPTPGFDVEKTVWNNGLGEYLRYYAVQGADGKTYWAIVTRGADGKEYTTYFDAAGNKTDQQLEAGSKPDGSSDAPAFDVESVVWNNGLGEYVRYFWAQGADGQGYWGIVTRGADGNEYTSYVDQQGNVIQGGVDVVPSSNNDADFDVPALAEQLGLGRYVRHFWVAGENGYGYWGIVAVGADGVESTTYVDEQGNVIQGGIDTSSPAAADASAENAKSYAEEKAAEAAAAEEDSDDDDLLDSAESSSSSAN